MKASFNPTCMRAVSAMPLQAMPVQRHITGAAMSGEAGVEASSFLDILGTIAKVAVPAIGQLVSHLG
jgi:hypothetical protein